MIPSRVLRAKETRSGLSRPSREETRSRRSETRSPRLRSPGTFAPVSFVPATQSLRFGPGYTVSVSPATNPPSLAVVDWKGAPVALTYNADGSATVAGYTAYQNGTVTGPGGLSIYLQSSSTDPLFSVGTTTVLKNGTIVDGSGRKLVPTRNPNGDGSYTAGDLTGWPNGFIIGSCGAVIYAGAPLTVTADGSVAFAPRAAYPVPGAAISANPATRSLFFGGYTVLLSGTGPIFGTGPCNKLSLLDSTGQPVTTTTNPDGSRSLGDYTLYKNGTIAAPGGRIAIDTAGPNAGLRVGRTTVLVNGTVLDGSGAKITPTGPNGDGSYSAGDVKGWANGTIIDTNSGVVLYAGAPLALTADGRVTLASPSLPTAVPSAGVAVSSAGATFPPADAAAPTAGATSPPAASTLAAAPPPPKTAGELFLPCFSYASPILLLCFSYASPMLLLCFSYASPMLLLCFSYASPMLLLCFSFASPMLLLCFSHASPMILLCFSYASPMLLPCFSYASPMLLL
ncbi:unnamed protein product [Closterium sp. Naga37s-1]|nr:unnamed protein product [Closterium sp. Naga37s-1]